MKLSEPSYHDWMDDRIEAFLDGDLSVDEHDVFEGILADDADWEAELYLARQIRTGLRTLPQLTCPAYVTESVLAHVQRQHAVPWMHRLVSWLEQQWATLWQPALAMAVLLTIVISASMIGPEPPKSTIAGLDPEVEQALAEVQWTLAFLSEMGRETGKAVRNDVIRKHVVGTVQHALGSD